MHPNWVCNLTLGKFSQSSLLQPTVLRSLLITWNQISAFLKFILTIIFCKIVFSGYPVPFPISFLQLMSFCMHNSGALQQLCIRLGQFVSLWSNVATWNSTFCTVGALESFSAHWEQLLCRGSTLSAFGIGMWQFSNLVSGVAVTI